MDYYEYCSLSLAPSTKILNELCEAYGLHIYCFRSLPTFSPETSIVVVFVWYML